MTAGEITWPGTPAILNGNRPGDDDDDGLTPAERAAERMAELRGSLLTAKRLDEIPPPDPLIDGWLYSTSLCWLFGKRGHAKSFVALDMAGCIGAGIDWHGYPAKQRPVVYAALEGAPGMSRRVHAWEAHYDREMTGVHFLVPRKLHVLADQIPLAGLVKDGDAGLLIIDTQNRATTGLEENSSRDMGYMIEALEGVAQTTGCCVLMLHHTSDGFRPRGHTSIDGAATSMIRVAKDGGLVKVAHDKQKDEAKLPSLMLAVKPVNGSLALVPERDLRPLADSEILIRTTLKNLASAQGGGASNSELKRACTSQGQAEATFYWALNRQMERGAITKDGPRYTLHDLPTPTTPTASNDSPVRAMRWSDDVPGDEYR